MAYAEIGNPALGLAAYGARLPDAPWPRANLSLRPIANSGRTQRRLRLQAAFGSLRSLAFTAQLLQARPDRDEVVSSAAPGAQLFHAGSNGGEVVSSAGPVHGVSSLRLGLVLAAARSFASWP